MVVKRIIILLFVIMFFNNKTYSQEEGIAEEDKEFIKLVDAYVTHYISDDYKNYQSLSNQFGKLMGVTSFDSYEHIFEDWIVKNLDKTRFSSVKEAIDLYDKLQKASDEANSKLQELDKERIILSKKSGDEYFDHSFSAVLSQQLLIVTMAEK